MLFKFLIKIKKNTVIIQCSNIIKLHLLTILEIAKKTSCISFSSIVLKHLLWVKLEKQFLLMKQLLFVLTSGNHSVQFVICRGHFYTERHYLFYNILEIDSTYNMKKFYYADTTV